MIFGSYRNDDSRCFGLRCVQSGKEVALKSIVVSATVGHVIAHVQSELLYRNDTAEAVEAVFKFPLDDGCAVYRMEAKIDGRTITAECQEKYQAQETYDDAMSRGMTTFLLQEDKNSCDIFMCSLGNLPSQKEVKLTIAYVVELALEMNGSVKFTLPLVLNPRYNCQQQQGATFYSHQFAGLVNQKATSQQTVESGKGSYSFSLNITIQSQCSISNIETECKDLSVEIQEPSCNTAQVTFSSEECILDSDIILFIKYDKNDQPTAIIERGSSAQDGIMKLDMLLLNFYPEIKEASRKNGEYIFVIDRSGSMKGPNILNAVQTLMLLVKSLRPGFYFNIISFGSNYSCLFEKSVEYNRENSLKAVDHINRMEADFGGTELLTPLTKIFQDSLVPNNPKQVFVLTDGAISNVNDTLELVKRNSKTARLFSVGIGQGASSALVKGLARAGHGRYEFVYGDDRLQQKVMSLMKFSLQPEIRNLSLEWSLSPGVTAVSIPECLPTIFVGELVTLYAIICGAERHEIVCGNVTLAGDIDGQSFEYQLEFEGRGQSDDTTVASPIHRLAAKALVKDLEIEEMAIEGSDKKNEIVLASIAANIVSKYTSFVGLDKESRVPIKQIKPSEPSHPVQLFGGSASMFGCAQAGSSGFSFGGSGGLFGATQVFGGPSQPNLTPSGTNALFGASQPTAFGSAGTALFGSSPFSLASSKQATGQPGGLFGSSHSKSGFDSGQPLGQLFGSAQPAGGFGSPQQKGGFGSSQQTGVFGSKLPPAFGSPQPSGQLLGSAQPAAGFGSPQQTGGFGSTLPPAFGSPQPSGQLLGSAQPAAGFGSPQQTGGFGSPQQTGGFGSMLPPAFGSPQPCGQLFGSAQPAGGLGSAQPMGGFGSQPLGFGAPQAGAGFGASQPGGFSSKSGLFGGQSMGNVQSVKLDDELIEIISLQDFDGSWQSSEQLTKLMKISEDIINPPEDINSICWVTCLVLIWLEKNYSNRRDEWDLIYNKASDWLTSMLGAKSLDDLKALAVWKMGGK